MIAFHNQFIIYEYSTDDLKNESIMKYSDFQMTAYRKTQKM